MATTLEHLVEQAMQLSAEARARLADILVESLDADELGRIEQLWADEADRRREQIRTGGMKAVPADEARQRIRRALGK